MLHKTQWLILTMLFVNTCSIQSLKAEESESIFSKISKDYENFYSKDRLTRIAIGFSAAGIMANTKIDKNIQDWYQDDMRGDNFDDISHQIKKLGERRHVIPITLLSFGFSYFDTDSVVGEWGNNTLRSLVVGLPVVWSTQALTGASRPRELRGSDWRPFDDDNGVSGHAFVGALPFLNFAKMSNNSFVKYASYTVAGLSAWSRINDDYHFTSQALLGLYLAYESVDAVYETNNRDQNISFIPIIGDNFYGINISATW